MLSGLNLIFPRTQTFPRCKLFHITNKDSRAAYHSPFAEAGTNEALRFNNCEEPKLTAGSEIVRRSPRPLSTEKVMGLEESPTRRTGSRLSASTFGATICAKSRTPERSFNWLAIGV